MIQLVLFLILTVLSAAVLAGIILQTVCFVIARIKKKTKPKQLMRLRKMVIFFALAMILNTGLITVSQLTASTPRIVDENGNTPENSIAELTKVELNGRKQWISIRGWDKNAPVLLFLAGGPGGQSLRSILSL